MSNPPDLDHSDRRELRARSREAGFRSLLLINGGSAAALLAFLQAIWSLQQWGLIQGVIIALALLALSLPIIVFANFNEALISLAHEGPLDRQRIRRLEILRLFLVGIAIVLFLVAVVSVCWGAWTSIPNDPSPSALTPAQSSP